MYMKRQSQPREDLEADDFRQREYTSVPSKIMINMEAATNFG